jgi:rhodanese-related sulfurtransferase
MAAVVDLQGVQKLLESGGQLLEVLPREEYEEMHLPGAMHIPLKELDRERADALLDRSRAVVAYCWDALCDMSPRAVGLLSLFGYEAYDYAASKVDWLAHGLPIEGGTTADVTALTLLRRDVATCAIDDAPADVSARIERSPYGFALALSADRVVLGRVRRSRLAEARGEARVEEVMDFGPSTIRPHTAVADLAARVGASDVQTLIVTDPEGRLLGVVRRSEIGKPV